jgi:secondary thiamine-phosphate synthase enzyme
MDRFTVETEDRLSTVDVTAELEAAIPEGVDGVCTALAKHTTAALTVNEAESRLLGDVETFLSDLVPDSGWDHDRIDDNADSHLRAGVLGPSVSVPVADGELALGTWQSVILVECDGPRTREVVVEVAGSATGSEP